MCFSLSLQINNINGGDSDRMNDQRTREILYFKMPVVACDIVIHLSALSFLARFLPGELLHGVAADSLLYVVLIISYLLAINLCGIRLQERKIHPWAIVRRAVAQTLATYVAFTLLVVFVYKAVPRLLIVYQFLITVVLISVAHYVIQKLIRLLRKYGHNSRRVVIIGEGEIVRMLNDELTNGQVLTGYLIQGCFPSADAWMASGKYHPDVIFCSLSPVECRNEVNGIIRYCNDNFIDFYFVPAMDGYSTRYMTIDRLGDVNVIRLRQEPLANILSRFVKRSMDIVVSVIFLCTIYQFVYIFAAIGIKLSSPGPVYFRQRRTGYNGDSFMIYKFRTMRVSADADVVQATEDDTRKTRFGDFLRRTSIDELPQFINVLKGEMSIVGPRPHMEHHTEVYSKLVADYMVRHLAKPGITGYAQINGCRGETKEVQQMADRVKKDIWYIEHWSLWLDIEIILRTVGQCFLRKDEQAY